MKTLSNYRNFLTDKEVYLENQNFWNDKLAQMGQGVWEKWVSTTFTNGDDFFDGNPIASAFYPQVNKAVRIIQTASHKNSPLLRAWLEKVDYNSTIVQELVVVVQPYDEAYHAVNTVLVFFLHEPNDKSINTYIRAVNALHKQVASMKKAVSVIRTVDPGGLEDDLLKNTIGTIYRQTAVNKSNAFKRLE